MIGGQNAAPKIGRRKIGSTSRPARLSAGVLVAALKRLVKE
jgi:hypothetical protein